MDKIHITLIIDAIRQSDFLWILVPIFFIGIITDKYQEEFKTSVGNAISNGALIIFTGFSWLQLIFSRQNFPIDFTISQIFLSLFIIGYGFAIIASGFKTGKFATIYGRIRVVTFMLLFFTIIIYIPILYNLVSIILFVLLFPFYYAFITELIKIFPSSADKKKFIYKEKINIKSKNIFKIGNEKLNEYLK